MNKVRAELIRKGIIKPAPRQEPSLERPVKAVRLLDDRPVPKQQWRRS